MLDDQSKNYDLEFEKADSIPWMYTPPPLCTRDKVSCYMSRFFKVAEKIVITLIQFMCHFKAVTLLLVQKVKGSIFFKLLKNYYLTQQWSFSCLWWKNKFLTHISIILLSYFSFWQRKFWPVFVLKLSLVINGNHRLSKDKIIFKKSTKIFYENQLVLWNLQ